MNAPSKTPRARGQRLLVLLPGLGAVATTFIAGVELIRRGKAAATGSLTQLGHVRRGDTVVPVRDLVPLCDFDHLVFGAWDIGYENAAVVADRAAVLSPAELDFVRPLLSTIAPRPGVLDQRFLDGSQANHVIRAHGHRDRIDVLRNDIREMQHEHGADRAVMILCTSTERHREEPPAASSIDAFERALDNDDPAVNPSLLYAYAAIVEGVPFANATSNRGVETPALRELARREGVPIAGRDLKSGESMLRTAIAPALKARLFGVRGWFSSNIVGQSEVADDPRSLRAQQLLRACVVDGILRPEEHPELYGEIGHAAALHLHPWRGTAQESCDSVELFGWLGHAMQLKVSFVCNEAVMAAPLVADLALFLDLARARGRAGVQDWLAFYFKTPMAPLGARPVHDLFAQRARLEDELLSLAALPTRRKAIGAVVPVL